MDGLHLRPKGRGFTPWQDKPNLDYSDLLGKEQNLIILFKYPSFEKITHDMSNLTKFVMSMIKSQFDVKPNRRITWLINNCLIQKGFSVIPLQARYNNISMICSYPDINFFKSHKEDAASVLANCKIKIEMKTDNEYALEYKTGLYCLNI